MKRAKFDSVISVSRLRSIQVLMGLLFLYFFLVTLEIPLISKLGFGLESYELISAPFDDNSKFSRLSSVVELSQDPVFPSRKAKMGFSLPHRKMGEFKTISGLIFDEKAFDSLDKDEFSELHKVVRDAFVAGKKLFQDIESGKVQREVVSQTQNRTESCPNSVTLWGSEFLAGGKIMVIPCGLTLGSHITVVGTPRWAHEEKDPKITLVKDDNEIVMVSQFMMELQGLKTVDGEDPPRILHFNPRLKGDWSGRPVIEQNTCYRMQWGSAMRCDGWKSKPSEDTGEEIMLSMHFFFRFCIRYRLVVVIVALVC